MFYKNEPKLHCSNMRLYAKLGPFIILNGNFKQI